ncbi:MAG: EAL domain-containing protein [Xanthomonadales bacterium]|nr:EAL domain-containing protein [Xanthomonadales bacterium]
MRSRRAFLNSLLWTAALLCATPALGFSPEPFFKHIPVEGGIGANRVTAIAQGPSGFIWIGTESGLYRYDGAEFLYVSPSPDAPESAQSSFVTSLIIDDAGRIWAGLEGGGIDRFDPSTGTVTRISTELSGGSNHGVRQIYEDPEGRIWIASQSGLGLHSPRTDRLQSLVPRPGGVNDLANDAGRWWVGTRDGLFEFDPGSGELSPAPGEDGLPVDEPIWRVLPGDEGVLWLGTTNQGLIRYDSDDASEQRFVRDPQDPEGLTDDLINALLIDGTGMLWVATYNGLNLLDPTTGRLRRFSSRNQPGAIRQPYVSSLFRDASGILWVGTYGEGLFTLPPRWRAMTHYAAVAGRTDLVTQTDVHAVLQTSDGTLWSGTYSGHLSRIRPGEPEIEVYEPAFGAQRIWDLAEAEDGVWLATNNGLMRCCERAAIRTRIGMPGGPLRNDVWVVTRDLDNRLWTAIYGSGVAWLDGDQLVSMPLVDGSGNTINDATDLAVTSDGHIVAATYRHGLFRLDRGGEKFQPLATPPLGAPVNEIAVDATDRLWIGTRGNGLVLVDPVRPVHFRTHAGLPSNTINGLASDGRDLWVATDNGLARIDLQHLGVVRLAGLPDRRINHHSLRLGKDDSLLIGTRSGLYHIGPDYFEPPIDDPPVLMSNIFVAHEQTTAKPRQPLVVDHDRNEVRLEYRALDYLAADLIRYRHRLAGFEDDWRPSDGSAVYTGLPAGDYRFQFQAQMVDGRWLSGDAPLEIRVAPAPWRSSLAYLAYALALGGFAWLGIGNYRARLRAERQEHASVRSSKERLDLALWGSGDWLWDWEPDRDFAYCPQLAELLDIPSQAGEMRASDLVEAIEGSAIRARFREEVAKVRETGQTDIAAPFRDANGEVRWLRFRGRVVEQDDHSRMLRVTGTCRDITDWKDAETRLKLAARILENSRDAVAVLDLDGRFLEVNQAFERITGYTRDEVQGRPATILNSDRHDPDLGVRIRDALRERGEWSGEIWEKRKDGEVFLSMMRLSHVTDDVGRATHWVAVFADITRRRKSEEELRYLTNYDSLTGLPNRTLFNERLTYALTRRKQGESLVVCFLNIDGFTSINESLGLGAGDLVLRRIAGRLKALFGERDTIARLGGDEFAALIERPAEREQTVQRIQAILDAINEPMDLGDSVLRVTGSIGLAVHPAHGDDPATLVRHAHTALRAAKRRGSGRFEFYDPGMSEAAADRMQMALALAEATENGSLELHYQPKIDMQSGRVAGVEALLRWHNPGGDLISPETFIPLAEERGLIGSIGRWVMDQACHRLAELDSKVPEQLTMAVNLSARQIDEDDLVEAVAEAAQRWGVEPKRLRLELTESAVMETAGRSVDLLRRLKRLGVVLVMDDFGTGYSSLSYLNRLPLDQLKIDKSFVRNIQDDRVAAAIVRAVLSMASDLGLMVTAEGVERPEQLEFLKGTSCREVQGFLFSEPLPFDELVSFLSAAGRNLLARAACNEVSPN